MKGYKNIWLDLQIRHSFAMEMAKQLEQLRSETNESFIQAGNFDTPGGKVAVSNIENFIDTDGKSFHDIMQERIANLRHISQLLGEMEQV